MIPNTSAHTPAWTQTSYAFINVAPNPVGVGQTVDIVFWVDAPLPGALIQNDVRRHDYTLTITKPDSTIETKHWDVISDTTSIQFYQYTPDQVGNYTLHFKYGGQTYTWAGEYQNDTILPAETTTSLTVQEEQLTYLPNTPLPTEYWTRPIYGENVAWYSVSSNWLGSPYITGANTYVGLPGAFQPDGSAPDTAHIMWTKDIQYGGLVGGTNTAVIGESYYTGNSYNSRFPNGLIMQGTLFTAEPLGNAGSGGDYIAVDLRTGEELWRINTSETGISLVPQFGYLYSFESPNQHGNLPNGLLIAPYTVGGTSTIYGTVGGTTCWACYDPRNGHLLNMNITDIPTTGAGNIVSVANVGGPSGEYLKYVLFNYGTTTNPNYYLAQWNSSRLLVTSSGVSNWYSGTVNASMPSAYDWNISLPTITGSGWSIAHAALRQAFPLASVDNLLLLVQGSFGGHPGDMGAVIATSPANLTAINLKPTNRGTVLWAQAFEPAPGNNTRTIAGWDVDNGVFVFEDTESIAHYGYSLATGKQLWTADPLPDDSTADWNYLSLCNDVFAYGKFYYYGYSGILYCYDVKTGNLDWTYGNGDTGNSTISGLDTPYGRYPVFVSTIADGKVYLTTTEHSPNSPIFKGALLRAINATDGTELWTLSNFGGHMYGGNAIVADGYLTLFNAYDGQLYTVGKGASKTTVSAPNLAAMSGQSIVISGSVMDISAGTTQNEQAARFPSGVPVSSDASMNEWMAYVYQQQPKPITFMGVSVTISVIDSNGNFRTIGTPATDSSGFYSLKWTPDIEGEYRVIATFEGTNGYYGSSAEAAFAVDDAPLTTAPQATSAPSAADLYFVPAIIGVIVAIIAVGAVLALLVTKKP
jgi:hypothetical protein